MLSIYFHFPLERIHFYNPNVQNKTQLLTSRCNNHCKVNKTAHSVNPNSYKHWTAERSFLIIHVPF